MFTGIVSDVGTIRSSERKGDLRMVVDTAYDTGGIDFGASISCSGVCLTVVDKGPQWVAFDVSGETVSRTASGQWEAGRKLNLERALRLGEELGGHIVTGHVDGVGQIVSVTEEGGSHRVIVSAPAALAPYIAPKGSITLDGVSLTVNTVEDQADGSVNFMLNIIPHTAEVTTLGAIAAGQSVNLEIDVLARYLQRMEAYRAKL